MIFIVVYLPSIIMSMIPIFVGYDPKESVCFHVAVSSLTRLSSQPLAITPLNLTNIPEYTETHDDSSNTSSYTRFLVPHLMNYAGWAIYVDCDVLALSDILELWNLKDDQYAVMCAKHNYSTRTPVKFLNNSNSNYPKKNWSSVMLINCGHPKNKQITPRWVSEHSGEYLHQFQWLDNSDIGSIPTEWNWLVGEYPKINGVKLLHYTLGAPCFMATDYDTEWEYELAISQHFLQ